MRLSVPGIPERHSQQPHESGRPADRPQTIYLIYSTMEYVLVFIRMAFYFLAMLLFLFYKLGYKPGFLHPRIRPL